MERNVSILDVAAAAGVSKSTASRALLGDAEVSVSTRRRVQDAADRIGYVKDIHAHSLKAGVNKTVAIYVRSVQLSFYGELIAAIQRTVETTGYRVAVVSASKDDRPLQTLLSLRPAAAVVASGRVDLDSFENHHRVPIVLAGTSNASRVLSSVSDDGSGCEALAQQVAAAGHARVGVLEVPLSRSRTLGIRSHRICAALEALGVEVHVIPTDDVNDGPDPVALRASVSSITALMCPNDPSLVLSWELLSSWGLRVPEDMSLTGYDGVGHLASPAIGLTTWAQPIAEIGAAVAHELRRRLEDPSAAPAHLALTGQLIPGRTLSPPTP